MIALLLVPPASSLACCTCNCHNIVFLTDLWSGCSDFKLSFPGIRHLIFLHLFFVNPLDGLRVTLFSPECDHVLRLTLGSFSSSVFGPVQVADRSCLQVLLWSSCFPDLSLVSFLIAQLAPWEQYGDTKNHNVMIRIVWSLLSGEWIVWCTASSSCAWFS